MWEYCAIEKLFCLASLISCLDGFFFFRCCSRSTMIVDFCFRSFSGEEKRTTMTVTCVSQNYTEPKRSGGVPLYQELKPVWDNSLPPSPEALKIWKDVGDKLDDKNQTSRSPLWVTCSSRLLFPSYSYNSDFCRFSFPFVLKFFFAMLFHHLIQQMLIYNPQTLLGTLLNNIYAES